MVSKLDNVLVFELLENLDLLAEAFHVLAVFALARNELERHELVGNSVDATVYLPKGPLADELMAQIFADFFDFHI